MANELMLEVLMEKRRRSIWGGELMVNDKPVEICAVVPTWVRDQVLARQALMVEYGRRVPFAELAGELLADKIRGSIIFPVQGLEELCDCREPGCLDCDNQAAAATAAREDA